MDNDIFIPLKVRGSQILGLKKLIVGAIESSGINLIGKRNEEALIRWLVESKIGAAISGVYHEGEKLPGDPTNYGELFLVANPEEEAEEGIILLSAIGSTTSTTRVEVETKHKSGAGYKNAVIFDGAGESSFLQLAALAKKKVSFKTINLAINNGATESGELTVNHELGGTISGFLAGQIGASGFAIPISCKMVKTTGTTATFRLIASSAMPGTSPVNFTFFVAMFS